MSAIHDIRTIGSTRGANGRRTVFYGYCTCGAGTTNSANQDSVRAKLVRHAEGDQSGMVRDTVREP